MLTITTLVNYRKPEPTKTLTKKERRALARESGRCGTCVTGYPQPGRKTCPACLERARRSRS